MIDLLYINAETVLKRWNKKNKTKNKTVYSLPMTLIVYIPINCCVYIIIGEKTIHSVILSGSYVLRNILANHEIWKNNISQTPKKSGKRTEIWFQQYSEKITFAKQLNPEFKFKYFENMDQLFCKCFFFKFPQVG